MIGHRTRPQAPRAARCRSSRRRAWSRPRSARTCAPDGARRSAGTDAPWSSSSARPRGDVFAPPGARREPLSVALARDARRFGRGVGIRRDVSVTVSRHDGCDEPEAGGRAPPRARSEGVDADDVDASSSFDAEHGRTVLEPGRANLGAGSSRGGVALLDPFWAPSTPPLSAVSRARAPLPPSAASPCPPQCSTSASNSSTSSSHWPARRRRSQPRRKRTRTGVLRRTARRL